MTPRIKIVLERKPAPPPLPPFTCVICECETARDPYCPDHERPPVCFGCTIRTPRNPQLAGTDVEHWRPFRTVHALLCAIEQEAKRARYRH
ncbi:MAG: hypothetical protein KGH96_01150 [Sphingomonadales bacterium]|nr:hypothetical protein [Sphingomonadales bacterium]